MAVVEQKWSALPVPYAMELPDRVPKERYFDPDFYAMEVEQLWSRVWQMACRLEEIPQPRDFVEYEFLDQSVIVRAHRRHGGRRVPERLPPPRREGRRGQWNLRERVPVPVPRVVLRARRQEHRGHAAAHLRRAQPGGGRPRPHAGALRDVGRVRVDQLRRRRASGAGVPRARGDEPRRVEGGVDARREVVRVPPPGELEARHRGLRGDVPRRADAPAARHPHEVRAARRHAVRPAGLHRRRHPVPARDERRHGRHVSRRRRAHRREPARPRAPRRRVAGDGHVEPHAQRRGRALAPRTGPRHARSQRARRAGDQPDVLPRLPALLRVADVQQRLRLPVPPVGAGGDADGDLVAGAVPRGARSPRQPTPPEVWECDDPRWPAIPAQDFSNLPRQQKGLHARGFEYMRLSRGLEGHISNFQRTIDGYLAGLPHERLLPALAAVNVYPFEQPMLDLGF